MLLNVDGCDIVILSLLQVMRVLTMNSLKFWCEVLIIVLGCMRMSDDTSGAQLAGEKGEDLPCPFLKIWKTCPGNEKNALRVFIHGLNAHLCSHLKELSCFKTAWRKNSEIPPSVWFFCYIVDEKFIKMHLF